MSAQDLKWFALLAALALSVLAERMFAAMRAHRDVGRNPDRTSAVLVRRLELPGFLLCSTAVFATLAYAFGGFGIDLIAALSIVLVVPLLFLMLRANAPAWQYLVLIVALTQVPRLFPEWATYWHGFLHTSIVYEIFERGMPPENPLMAGEPVFYPWGHHALAAWLMRLVPISPPQAFMLLDAVILTAFFFLIERTACLLFRERVARVFSIIFTFYAMSPLAGGPLGVVADRALSVDFDHRLVPLSKFAGINNNQIGLLFFALGLYGLASIASGRGRNSAYIAIGVALLAAGFFYPISWLGLATSVGACAIYFWLCRSRATAVALIAIVGVCSALLLPLLLSLASGKSDDAAMHFVTGARQGLRHIRELMACLVLPVVLMWIQRGTLVAALRQQRHVYAILSISAAVNSFLYLAISMPSASEYKFLHMTAIALSFPAALALFEVYRARVSAAFVVICLAMWPGLYDEVALLLHKQPVSDLVYSEGRRLRHRDPDEDALYSWIRENTSIDAVFIDTYLTIPPIAGRPLLVGLDSRRQDGDLKSNTNDGWLVTADQFLRTVTGVNSGRLAEVRQVTEMLVSEKAPRPTAQTIAAVADLSRGRPLYVVARGAAAVARLEGLEALNLVYRGEKSSVFELVTIRG